MHPGYINNQEELCEKDTHSENLYGTGTTKGLERENVDMYIDRQHNIQSDFIVVNEELWSFLLQRYGGQCIQRIYYRTSQYCNYTQVESKLRDVSLKLLDSQILISGQFDKDLYTKKWWTQI